MALIVVGVDGSEGSKAALRFALEEARLRGATLHAVHAWDVGYVGAASIEGTYPVLGDVLEDLRRNAEATLDAMLAGVSGGAEGVEIERRVVAGPPAPVLVDESRGADLLVVGSRGHGGFAGLMLGSVGQQVAHHATCPVVIVHRRDE